MRESSVVAAIEFGTKFSKIAFSLRSDYENNRTEHIDCCHWQTPDGIHSALTSTCLLLKPDTSLHSFGYEADAKYNKLVEEDAHREWYYFQHFKLQLYNTTDNNVKNISPDITLTDSEGRRFSALRVFTYAVEYIKEKIITILNNDRCLGISEDDIYFILTTPAIWGENGKIFFRDASLKAHISAENLGVVFESECAAIYAHNKHVQTKDRQDIDGVEKKHNPCYVVVDLEECAHCIAVYRNEGDQFSEIVPPTGGLSDLDTVDMEYEHFLRSTLKIEAFKRYQNDNTDHVYLMMKKEFEVTKCTFRSNCGNEYINLMLPASLIKFLKQEKHAGIGDCYDLSDEVKIRKDMLRIKSDFFARLFTKTIDNVLYAIKESTSNFYGSADTLVCVGRSFRYESLKAAVHAKYSDMVVIIPEESEFAVIKGALHYAWELHSIDGEVNWKEKLIVAAIDFGTTYSGFALSYLSDYRVDKTKRIITKLWKSGDQNKTSKTPTCLLLAPDSSFHSFGYKAENKYTQLAEKGQHKNWRFFRRFKMSLYKPTYETVESISLKSTVNDVDGRSFDALTIFAMSIDYMRTRIIKTINKSFPALVEDHIYYVLTTPAIWTEQAKLFMREAALKAKIPSRRLCIALEPECAAVYVQATQLDAFDEMQANERTFKPGTCHMIVDLGGGTLDIAVHRINDNCQIEEVIYPRGGAWGADAINIEYEQFLTKISGEPALTKFLDEGMEDYLDMQRQFEHKKCAFTDAGDCDDSEITLRLPSLFKKLHKKYNNESISNSFRQMPVADDIRATGDKMRIKTNLFRSFFTNTINGVLKTVDGVLSVANNKKVTTIICVGGFSDCKLLKDALRTKFSDMVVIIPEEAVSAVMKGAVIFGRDQSVVNKRISRYTYGLDWNEDFDPAQHDPEKREETDDGPVCRDIFKTLIVKGDEIPYNKPTQEIEAYVKSKYQTVIEFPFYRSEILENPVYIDEIGCHLIGTMSVDIGESRSLDSCVKLKVYFGATELRAEAKDEIGKQYEVKFKLDN